MTITNDERHEVAAKLRENEYGLEYFTLMEILGFDEDAEPYFDGYHRKPELLARDVRMRLADLIEPESERTCTVTRILVDLDGTHMTDYSCGCFNNEGWNHNYCPNCGARVVDKEN